jgi:predicted enzyme related to lactoylglutathione lyase
MVLAFQKVGDPTPGKNKIHLDLGADNRAAEVARLVAAGASFVAEHEHDGFGWTTLADPDGNQFCVAEHSEQ